MEKRSREFDILYLLEYQEEIKPKIFNFGLGYTLNGEMISIERIKEYENKLLEPVGKYSFPICSVCGSSALTLYFKCPSCGNRVLTKHDFIVHYECGHLAPVEAFSLDENGSAYICPKCKKKFNKIGIDYGMPGLGFKCESCNYITQYPQIEFECDKGHVLKLHDLNVTVITSYKINQYAANTYKEFFSVYEFLKESFNSYRLLKGERVEVEFFYRLRFGNGETQIIPLLINLKGNTIIVDYLPNVNDMVQWSRIIDRELLMPSSLTVIVTDEPVNERLLKIFNVERIRIIQKDKDWNSAKFAEYLLSLIGEKVLRVVEEA